MITDMFGRELRVGGFVLYSPLYKISVGRILNYYGIGDETRLKLTGPHSGSVSWQYASDCIKLHPESTPASVLEKISRDFPDEQ